MSVAARRRSERRLALTIVGLFLLIGVLWVVATDIILYGWPQGVKNAKLVARLETAKEWSSIGLAGLALYAIAARAATRLTRAHAATAAVLNSIGDGVLLLGSDRTIVGANPAAVRMLGCRNE